MNKVKLKSKKTIAFGVALLILIPFLIACFFTVLSTDDFGFIMRYNRFLSQASSTFDAILASTHDMYVRWQGTHISNFLIYLFIGIYPFTVLGLKIYLFINFVLLLSSIYCVISALFKLDIKVKIYIFIFVFLLGFTVISPGEYLYWLIGTVYYSLPASFVFFGIASYLKLIQTNQNKYFVLAMIFGGLASGGSLVVVGFLNAIYLSILGIYTIVHKKVDKKFVIPFLICFIGALLNAFAPGNFLRREVINGNQVSMISVLYFTIRWMKNIAVLFFKNGNILFITAFVVGFYPKMKETVLVKLNPWIILSISFISIFASIFPFILGIGVGNEMPSRVMFTINVFASVMIFISLFSIVHYLNIKYKEKMEYIQIKRESKVYWLIGAMLLMNLTLTGNMYKTLVSEIVSNNMQKFYDNQIEIMEIAQSAPEGTEVVIPLQRVQSRIQMGTKIGEDATFWVNEEAAQYFNVKSIQVKYTD